MKKVLQPRGLVYLILFFFLKTLEFGLTSFG